MGLRVRVLPNAAALDSNVRSLNSPPQSCQSAFAPLAVARDGRRACQRQPVGSDAIAEVSDLAWLTEFKL